MSMQTAPGPGEKPVEQRPERPEFWCKRFSEGVTPWDAGRVPQDVADFVATAVAPERVLVPGCGSAWEAAHFAAAGWPAIALDFSPEAIARAAAQPGMAAVDLVCADFFTYELPQPVSIIYERAFLCALPRKCWADWATRVAALLPPGGRLAGYFFVCDQLKGPPFGITDEALQALLAPAFARVEDRPVNDSIPVFAGRERWQVWVRR